MSRVLTTLPVTLVSLQNAGLFWLNVRLFFSPAPDVCGRPRSDRLCTLTSHGASAWMGNLCLGSTDFLLWPLRALQGGDAQDFRSFCFGREASRLLTTLHQGRRSVADFAIEFRTLAITCEWNEPALVARFLEGLNWISSSNWVFAWTGASS